MLTKLAFLYLCISLVSLLHASLSLQRAETQRGIHYSEAQAAAEMTAPFNMQENHRSSPPG